jgi:hypothetical protein
MLRGHGVHKWLDSFSMSDALQYTMESEIINPSHSVVRGLHLSSPAWATALRLMLVWGTLKSRSVERFTSHQGLATAGNREFLPSYGS